jgi:phospholipid/cholesterol/gamma-HCH transport system substrate-binding protein
MQQTRSVEIGTGLFIFLGLAAVFFLSTRATGLGSQLDADAYEVYGRFENVGSLKERAPVSMAGVTIGRVTSVEFDPDRLEAIVRFKINGKYNQIPDDSDASILTSGLLGSQYIGLQAGGSDTNLQAGSEIQLTQSAMILEKLVSKYLFSSGSKNDE